jgi:uncharacterized protein (TIGR02117 family)
VKRQIFILCSLACAGWLAACATPASLPPADHGPRTEVVHVISNGWHTAIVIPHRELVSNGQLPEAEDFPRAAFLEFGWGDRVYYPAEEKTLGMALGAALIPTPAVMHIAALARAPRLTYPGFEVVAVALTKRGIRYLVGAIAGEFKRPKDGRAVPISRGLYPESNFYGAHGKFHLFNTLQHLDRTHAALQRSENIADRYRHRR